MSGIFDGSADRLSHSSSIRSSRSSGLNLLMLISSRAITAVWHFPLSVTRMVSQTLAREVQPSIQLVENGYINRVLTLTVSEARVQELCTKTRALLSEERAWKHYFFSSVRNFSLQNPSSVLQSVYLRPGKSERYPLMPEPKPSQTETSVL